MSQDSSLQVKPLTNEEVLKVKENFAKLLSPFSMKVSHKDDNGNEGSTVIDMSSETILGALTCLESFSSFQNEGWKTILVQELFHEAERDLVTPEELNNRLVARMAEENNKTFREGTLVFKFSFTHPFLKTEKEEEFLIDYKYNQILHLVEMVNKILTDNFASGVIKSIQSDLNDGENRQHSIKLT